MKMIQSILLILICLFLTACNATDGPIVMGSTNLDGVNISTETNAYPIFVNGSLAEGTFTYDGETEPTVSLTDLVVALCGGGFAEISGEGDVLTMRYAETVLANQAVHAEDLTIVTLTEASDTVHIQKPDAEETLALSEPVALVEGIVPDVVLPWSDAAAVLGLNGSFYDGKTADAGTKSMDGADVSFYLYDVPHLMFWQYPEKAAAMSGEEAVRQVRDHLIAVFEHTYDVYAPDAPVLASSKNAQFLYDMIENLTVLGENDRFWRLSGSYDHLVDKYTGEMYSHAYDTDAQEFGIIDAELSVDFFDKIS